MLNWLLQIYNSGVVDTPTTGSSKPIGYAKNPTLPDEVWFILGLILGIGITLFFCILISEFKKKPNEDDEEDDE